MDTWFPVVFVLNWLWQKPDERVLLQDWNQFLESISNLLFCVPGNGSAEVEFNPSPKKKSDSQSDSQSLLVPLVFSGGVRGETPRFLSTSLLGSQVGLKGRLCTQDLVQYMAEREGFVFLKM